MIATAWLRLESPINQPLRSVAVAGLAVLPALVQPLATRIAALVLSAATAVWIAYGLSPLHPRHLPGAVWSRFSGGVVDFYDVRTPFDPRVHCTLGTAYGRLAPDDRPGAEVIAREQRLCKELGAE